MEKKQLLDKMRLTKDKSLYDKCPLDLLSDFDFVTEVIKIYKDDFDFVEEVAEQYVKFIPEENINSNPQFIELCMLLGQFVPDGHSSYEFYTTRLDGIYSMFLLHVVMVRDEIEGVSHLGFSILLEDYGKRKNILDYFALRLMNELYHKNHCGTFEDLIHKHCDNCESIRQEGYEQFFVRNLYGVDEKLSYYIFDNPHLLKELIEELDLICDNWYEYEEKLSIKCVEIIRGWVVKKKEEEAYGIDFDYEQAMNEVLLSMNFCEMFGLDRREVYANKSSLISFNSARFKRELKEIIERVLMERLTLTELDTLNLDGEEAPKKVLKP